MHKSPAKLILLSFCFQGLTLVPALPQAVVPADGRVGVMNAPIPSTAADAAAAAPANVTSYVLGPEGQITVRVFAADGIPDKPVQIDHDGTVTVPMIGQVHAAGLTVEQFQANQVTAYKKYFKDPQVTVQVNDFRSQPVSVEGNVTNLTFYLRTF
jgi:protein involved in polysaccharide export with SLBB domain